MDLDLTPDNCQQPSFPEAAMLSDTGTMLTEAPMRASARVHCVKFPADLFTIDDH
jgi:hypothetical protein